MDNFLEQIKKESIEKYEQDTKKEIEKNITKKIKKEKYLYDTINNKNNWEYGVRDNYYTLRNLEYTLEVEEVKKLIEKYSNKKISFILSYRDENKSCSCDTVYVTNCCCGYETHLKYVMRFYYNTNI